jgi:hypothetical protein
MMELNPRTATERLGGVWNAAKGEGLAKCPAHDDQHPSLSIGRGSKQGVVFKCHAGCSQERVWDAVAARLGLGKSNGAAKANGANGADADHEEEEAEPADENNDAGCTLAEYAAAKRLPEQFLDALGVFQVQRKRKPAVAIPYFDENGEESAVRLRLAMHGKKRFCWATKGTKPTLYGLDQLFAIREGGWVVIAEGESDTQTLWHTGFPALGLPGAGGWNEQRDAHHLDSIAEVYLCVEPDQGGKVVLDWLRVSKIRERAKLIYMDPALKDVSALYLDNPESFRQRFDEIVAKAEPWIEIEEREREAKRAEAWAQCQQLAQQEDILAVAVADLTEMGLVGEDKIIKVVYLTTVSRLLDKIISIAVKGPSAGGKSFLVEQVLRLFPASAYHALTSMSDRFIVYDTKPIKHVMVVIYEAAGLASDEAAYLVRSLVSEGCVRYGTVIKGEYGPESLTIEREGPTGLIVTSTALSLDAEIETRMISVTVNDSPEHTARILAAKGRAAFIADPDHSAMLAKWHALQDYLASGGNRVVIPYAERLGKKIPPIAVRLRRDFPNLLALIKSHALLHQANRERQDDGTIIATLDDYGAVRELMWAVIAEGVDAKVPKKIQQTVKAVEDLIRDLDPEYRERVSRSGSEPSVSLTALAKHLGMDVSSVSRRVRDAIKRGYLRDLEPRRKAPGRTMQLVLGDPMDTPERVLPLPHELAAEEEASG